MNTAQAHLVLNHAPLFILGAGLVVGILALLRRHSGLGMLGLMLLLLAALATLPVYFSGNLAKEWVEKVPDASMTYVERHQNSARLALWVVELMGLVTLLALVRLRRTKRLAFGISLVLGVLALVAGFLVLRTSRLGGMIHHPEVRPPIVLNGSPPGESGGESETYPDEDARHQGERPDSDEPPSPSPGN